MKPVNDSAFAMWRCLVAFAYIDGKFTDEEKELLESHFENVAFNPKQRKIINNDFETGEVKFDEIYPLVTNKQDRMNLINIGRVLFYSDGEFSWQERDAMDKLLSDYIDGMDKDAVLYEAKEQLPDEELSKIHKNSDNPIKGIVDYIDDFLSS